MSTPFSVRRYFAILLWVLNAALFLSGCAGMRPAPALIGYPSPQAALRALAANAFPADQALTATARIEILRGEERFPVKVALMIERPALFRAESIPLLGPPDLFLSVANGELRVYLPAKRAFYIGSAVPGNISRFLPLFMSPDEMIPLLMGMAPDHGEGFISLRGTQEADGYRIDEYGRDGKNRSLWIDSSSDRLVKIRAFGGGNSVAYEADFAQYTPIAGATVPQQVRIMEEGGGRATLTLRYTNLRAVDTDPEAFPLPLPEQIKPILLDP